MAKRRITGVIDDIKEVSCSECLFKRLTKHPAIMWCEAIKMVMQNKPVTRCIYFKNKN